MTHDDKIPSPSLQAALSADAFLYEAIRTHVSQKFAAAFEGWSTAFDKHFDEHSVFLTLSCGAELLAGLRVISRSQPSGQLPFEMGQASSSLATTQQINLEYSGLWAQRPAYTVALTILAARWVATQYPQALAAVTYPAGNLLLHRLYVDSFGLTPVRGVCVQYDSITHRQDGRPVNWSVALDLPVTRWQRIERLAARPYAQRILSRCEYRQDTDLPTSLGSDYQFSTAGK